MDLIHLHHYNYFPVLFSPIPILSDHVMDSNCMETIQYHIYHTHQNLHCESGWYTFWNIISLQSCIWILGQSPGDQGLKYATNIGTPPMLRLQQCYLAHGCINLVSGLW